VIVNFSDGVINLIAALLQLIMIWLRYFILYVCVQVICLDISKEMEKKSFILRQG